MTFGVPGPRSMNEYTCCGRSCGEPSCKKNERPTESWLDGGWFGTSQIDLGLLAPIRLGSLNVISYRTVSGLFWPTVSLPR